MYYQMVTSVNPYLEHVRKHRAGCTDSPDYVLLNLGESLRILEALEDARDALRRLGLVPGLQDELATVIRVLHGKLGLEEGGLND
jgi:hypothetical protein